MLNIILAIVIIYLLIAIVYIVYYFYKTRQFVWGIDDSKTGDILLMVHTPSLNPNYFVKKAIQCFIDDIYTHCACVVVLDEEYRGIPPGKYLLSAFPEQKYDFLTKSFKNGVQLNAYDLSYDGKILLYKNPITQDAKKIIDYGFDHVDLPFDIFPLFRYDGASICCVKTASGAIGMPSTIIAQFYRKIKKWPHWRIK
jgi:hypothetical protein